MDTAKLIMLHKNFIALVLILFPIYLAMAISVNIQKMEPIIIGSVVLPLTISILLLSCLISNVIILI